MKKLCVAFALFLLAASVFGATQPSQTDSMTAFWDKFKAAAIKGDREADFALSTLPIEM